MAQPTVDIVNMSKIQFHSYAFHFLFAAAKGCLLPFMTVYLRGLGLKATQVGIIMGVGAWVTMFSATCWTSCAKSCNKYRSLLVGSTFALLASYMILMVVPPINDNMALQFCDGSMKLSPDNYSMLLNTTDGQSLHNTPTLATPAKSSAIIQLGTKPTTQSPVAVSPKTTSTTTAGTATKPKPSSTTRKPKPSSTTKPKPTSSTTKPTTVSEKVVTEEANIPDVTERSIDKKDMNNPSTGDNSLLKSLGQKEMDLLKAAGISLDDLQGLTPEDIQKLIDAMHEGSTEKNNAKKRIHRKNSHKHGRIVRREAVEDQPPTEDNQLDNLADTSNSLINTVWAKISQIQLQLDLLRNQLFAVVMVIIIFASLFGSPVEKVSDDIWFDFLDSSDMLEKYGQHRSWSSLGLILFPVITTVIIVHVPCVMFGHFFSSKIHFFAFGILMLFSFILAFMFPIYQNHRRIQRKMRLTRGFKILFTDCHAVMYTLTLIVTGILEAVLFNFLFWRVQDLGGSELVMGVAITVAAFSQLVMNVIHKWLVRKLSYAGAIVLGLVFLAGRLVLYSFIWTPWLILVGEAFHGLSIPLIWGTFSMYPDFRLNPSVMERSALTVALAVYSGFGLATGSIVGGYMMDMFSLTLVFQGGSIIAVVWAILFACSLKCVTKKSKVRYAKLLQEDNSQSDDDSSFDEDDWLEIALKHQK